jgi:hypothetical protein
MTIQEAENNLKEIQNKISDCNRTLNQLKIEESTAQEVLSKALIKNLPPGFKIRTKFYSGSYDRYFDLNYNEKTICSRDEGPGAELALANKAHELFNFMKVGSIV